MGTGFTQSWKSQGVRMEISFSLVGADNPWALDSRIVRGLERNNKEIKSWGGNFTALTQED